MGATITTFCNAAQVVVYTELSVAQPYYSSDLEPNQCIDFKVGRVWFTVTAKLSEKAGDLYFPVSENQAAGLNTVAFEKFKLDFIDLSPSEAHQIISSKSDIIPGDFESVSIATRRAKEHLSTGMTGYYANKNKKITITGGPKAAIYKEHPFQPGKSITIVPAHFGNLQLDVS